MASSSIDQSAEAVYFWKPEEKPYGVFGQWHKGSFVETTKDGKEVHYETAEQYMMRGKALLFNDPDIAQQVLGTTNPRTQRSLGRQVQNFDDKVWAENRSEIVKQGNYLKFTQDVELKQMLLDTGDREIVEASPRDRIWGVGFGARNAPKNRDRWGLNLLGKALMEVRDRIRKEELAA
ncbi:MAG: hypothetical protein M1837_001425 [Sclerophora amabilis]|nr:MAG: hypothetical protein M1837_001425 [Sclerophora amabilis]